MGHGAEVRDGIVMGNGRIGFLRSMPVFGGLADHALRFLLARTGTVSVPTGGFFFHENDMASSMYVLERGTVAIVKKRHGKDSVLRRLVTGDCFGEIALMDLCPRGASARAVEDSTAIELGNAALEDLYHADPEQFTMIQMNIGRELSRRLREADAKLFETTVLGQAAGDDYTFNAG